MWVDKFRTPTSRGSDRVTQKFRAQWMIECSEKDGALIFTVRVVPRASRSEIVGEHNGALKVRLAAPPG